MIQLVCITVWGDAGEVRTLLRLHASAPQIGSGASIGTWHLTWQVHRRSLSMAGVEWAHNGRMQVPISGSHQVPWCSLLLDDFGSCRLYRSFNGFNSNGLWRVGCEVSGKGGLHRCDCLCSQPRMFSHEAYESRYDFYEAFLWNTLTDPVQGFTEANRWL